MDDCNYYDKITDLKNNDFTSRGRLKGEIEIDADTILGIGTFAYVVLAGSANMPSEHNYILSNSVDVSTGNFTQIATPITSDQGRISFRTNTNGIFSNWNILAKMSDLGGGGAAGLNSIRTDNTSFPGPAHLPDLIFNFHEYWGLPQAIAKETQPGNATAKATDGQLDFFASYDSVQTIVEYSGVADVALNGYHITNVLLMSNGGVVNLADGKYSGDRVNITTYPNQQIVINANNLITTTGSEVWTFVHLIWDCELDGWVMTGFGTP